MNLERRTPNADFSWGSQALTIADLQKLDDDALFNYFTRHAQYHAESPHKKYAIRLGNRHLFSADTQDLYRQFFAAVRTEEMPE